MPGDVTLGSAMAAAPCGSWRHLAASFLGRPETVRRFVRIAHGRCSWSQSGAVSCLRASTTGLVIDAERPNASREANEWKEEEKERTVTTREEEKEREKEKEVSFSLILFFKLSNLMKKLVQFSSALKIRRSFIQDFERGNCATISQHREEISRVRFNISSLRLLKRLQLCPKTT
ncbi:hypothetical protein ALC57_14574 [Trachymyrmex cornetzi]|uniref:Uncharacterized protein n=1 Tax=Trachymyrmex cornetzi TaxID=471704 RepID=A0A151IY84_9HYME|nr:hypothetical protein ALC57_14574 [Trachymyrmex cornetzi]